MNIFFRVDSSTKIGGGHVVRCLRLANQLKGFAVNIEFICWDYEGNLGHKICDNNFKLNLIDHNHNKEGFVPSSRGASEKYMWELDLNETSKILNEVNSKIDLIIVDHYLLDHRWEKEISKLSRKLMVIDDLGNRSHYCDLLLDQGFDAQSKYDGLLEDDCIKLCGNEYVLLDPSFNKKRGKIDFELDLDLSKPVLVFFGTNDVIGHTIRFSRLILEHFEYISVKAIFSGNFNEGNELKSLSMDFEERFSYLRDIDNMPDEVLKCCLAVSSIGMTTWEYMCLGIPSCQITTEDYQIGILEKLDRAGLCNYIGHIDEINDKIFVMKFEQFITERQKILSIRENAMKQVDGDGLRRVVDQIMEVILE